MNPEKAGKPGITGRNTMNRQHHKNRKQQTTVSSSAQREQGTTRPPTVINVRWDGHEQIVAETPLHCRIAMAGNREVSSAGKYPSPLDLFVSSLGGCPSHEILAMMKERKKTLAYLAVNIEGTRRETPPTIFEKIHVTFMLAGDIDDQLVREVIGEVMTLRCSVAASFAKMTNLTWEYRIVPVVSLSRASQPAAGMPGGQRDFDNEAATWDEDPGRIAMARAAARAILGTIPPGKEMDVLDFGAGTGLVTLALQPHVRTITAADNSQGMLDIVDAKIRARNLANVRTRLVDLDRGDRPEGQFDLVVSSMTFHHIRDTGMLLGWLAGALRPSGRIAIVDLDPNEGKFHDVPDGVFHNGFDRRTMREYLEAAGFCDVRSETAAVVQKQPGTSGEIPTFSVFLMTGKKQG
jgi:uncharacterized OsmC-like protein/ubiquinone/menaquinone biosynthesis C-methylase UbiE